MNIVAVPVADIVRNQSTRIGLVRRMQERRAAATPPVGPEAVDTWRDYVLDTATDHRIDLSSPATAVLELTVGRPIGIARSIGARSLDLRQTSEAGAWPIAASSIDLVYSFWTAEHLRSPIGVLEQVRRVLKDDGIAIIRVDLRDHRDLEGDWLSFLKYSSRVWDAAASRRGCWTNRLRASQWQAMFESLFDVIDVEAERRELPAKFRRDRLARRFRDLPFNELRCAALTMVVRRNLPAATGVASELWSSPSITSAGTTN